jgi:8-oxo-dGTP pyrophosphatase MutT (NUDIX family)
MKQNITCSGALFFAKKTKRFLLLHRTNKRNQLWGLVGGKNEDGETAWKGLEREINEELGFPPNINKTIPLETFTSNDEKFLFHTYFCVVDEEFIPRLNHEHDGYAWVDYSKWPKPLHNGLQKTLKNVEIKRKLETLLDLIHYL